MAGENGNGLDRKINANTGITLSMLVILISGISAVLWRQAGNESEVRMINYKLDALYRQQLTRESLRDWTDELRDANPSIKVPKVK